jgi:hypothetical protein
MVYYAMCNLNNLPTNPIKQTLEHAFKIMLDISRDAETDKAIRMLMSKLLGHGMCSMLRQEHFDGISDLCQTALPGLSLVFGCTAITCLILLLLITMAVSIYRHYSARGGGKVAWHRATLSTDSPMSDNIPHSHDEFSSVLTPTLDDPFLEYSIANRTHRNPHNLELPLIQNQTQPQDDLPPEYNSVEYYRQYSDISPSTYEVRTSLGISSLTTS